MTISAGDWSASIGLARQSIFGDVTFDKLSRSKLGLCLRSAQRADGIDAAPQTIPPVDRSTF
jgi:hypothetical protein